MEELEVPKLPFNDYKHIPSRSEINLVLGVESAGLLKRFEDLLMMYDPVIDWAFHWYEEGGGWGYRASVNSRVVCVIQFYNGYYSVTMSIPLAKEDEFLALEDLNDKVRKQFSNYKLSPKAKWLTININTNADVEALAAMSRLKLIDLKEKRKK
jgi:uncharacterized protein DUF3788